MIVLMMCLGHLTTSRVTHLTSTSHLISRLYTKPLTQPTAVHNSVSATPKKLIKEER
jgi:hypothetical protein